MKKRSNIFRPGQRLINTMLTIVDSASPDSWQTVIVRCDCGKQFELPYMTVYARNRYSCGCSQRSRFNAVDHTGAKFKSRRGNGNTGRSLIVTGRTDQGHWQYICECCAEIFTLPRGLDGGLARSMREIAADTCPNHKRYYGAMTVQTIVNELTKLGYTLPNVALKTERARMLAKYYKTENIKWHPNGFSINGLRGLPDYPLPKEWRMQKSAPQESNVVDQFDEFGDTVID